MSNLLAYICWDADNLSRKVERSVQNDQPDEIARFSQNIKRGNEIMESWLLQSDGQGLLYHGDEGYAKVPSQKLEELQDIHQRMQDAYGDGLAFGVGLDLSEAKKALELATKRGGSRILFYTPEVDAELRGKDDKKDAISSLLDDNMEKADPSMGPPQPSPQMTPGNSPAGGGGFSPPAAGNAAPPASPQMSASEHSQGEAAQNFMDTHLPSAPSATNAAGDMEGAFHGAAAQGEQGDAQAEGQANAADGGGPPIDQLKAQIAQILMQVKQQAPVLEQLQQAAPEAYEAVVNVIKAMQLMMREVLTAPQGQEDENKEQAKPEAPEPAQKSEGENSHPLAKKVALTLSRDPKNPIEGELPNQYEGDAIERLPDSKQGQHGGTFRLGDKILKLTRFWHKGSAHQHVERLKNIASMNLAGVVPIHDVGIFGVNHRGHIFTYEVLKRLREPERRINGAYSNIQAELARHGLKYFDDHTYNIMENSRGEPQVVDLESIRNPRDYYGDAPGEDSGPRSPEGLSSEGFSKSLASKRVRLGGSTGRLPAKWANMKQVPVTGKDVGVHDSSYLVGRKHVLKIMHHHSEADAKSYLARLARLKQLKLSHVVPIHDFGMFGVDKVKGCDTPSAFTTFEVIKRAHKAPWHAFDDGTHWAGNSDYDEKYQDYGDLEGYDEARNAVQSDLGRQGLWHADDHPGNIMQNTQYEPVAIDLESIRAGGDMMGSDFDKEPPSPFRKSLAGLRVRLPSISGGPMPEAQVPPSGRVHAMLPAGSQIIEHRGKREQRKLKVLHTDPNGKKQTKHRQMDSGQAMPDNPQEALDGTIHPISTLAPKD